MAYTQITLDELHDSKIFVNPKSSAFNYQHPTQYSASFLDIAERLNCDLTIRVESNAMNANDDGSKNISYNSVLLRAKIPNMDLHLEGTMFNHMTSEIGFILTLDGLAPEIKAYHGKRVSVCDNGCIFGADDIKVVKLISDNHIGITSALNHYIDNIEKRNEQYFGKIEEMNNTFYSEKTNTLNQKIGEIVRYAMLQNKLGVQIATGMIKNITDTKSNYRIQDDKISAWTMYNACTEEIKKASIGSEAVKVQLLEGIKWVN